MLRHQEADGEQTAVSVRDFMCGGAETLVRLVTLTYTLLV